MATFTGNGTGSNMYGYMHARVYVTRTDNSDGKTCSIKVDCYAISDGGSSSFISGRVSKNEACSLWSDYSSEKSLSSGGTTFMTSFTFTVNRAKTTKTITCKAQIHGGGTGMYNGLTDTASVSVTIPALTTYTVSYNANKPDVTASVQGMPAAQTKYHGIDLTLSTNQPSLTNYIFKGWAGSASGSVLIQPGTSYIYTENANKTYYAKWELAYRKPEISNLTIFRTATSNGTTNNENGEYMRVSFSWAQDSSITGTNAPTIKIEARIKGSSSNYTTCKTETSTSGTSGTYATTVSFGSAVFAKMSSYDIQITITDNRSSKPSGNDGTTSVNDTLSQSYVLLDFSPEGGIGIGTTAPTEKQLDIGINFSHTGGAVTLDAASKAAWLDALGLGAPYHQYFGDWVNLHCWGHIAVLTVTKSVVLNGSWASADICTVPEQYRPSHDSYVSANLQDSVNNNVTLYIGTNGVVQAKVRGGTSPGSTAHYVNGTLVWSY